MTRNSLCDYLRKKNRENLKQDRIHELSIDEKTEDSVLESQMNKEWELHLAHLAMGNLRKKFSGKAIDVFYALLGGKTIGQVADEFDVAENTVYVYKNRVSEKMLAEIKYLKDQIG